MTSGAATARGLGFGALAFLAMAIADAMAKHLCERLPVFEVLLLRSVVILLALALLGRGRVVVTRRRLALQALRGVCLFGAAATFCLSLQHLELAEATALAFAAPLLITALAPAITGDRASAGIWSAVLVGLAGVLIVLQPGADVFEWVALLPVLCALCYALVMLLGRRLAAEVPLGSMLFWATVVTLGLTLPLAVADWVPPRWPDLLEAVAFGGFTLTMQYTLLVAYKLAPAPLVAPLDYTVLLWALLFGWLFWDEVPAPRLLPGAVLIVGAGLSVLWLQTRRPRRQP